MEMDNEKLFSRNFLGVAAPQYRGAPYPFFNKLKINESSFFDGFRYKEYDWDFNEDGVLTFDWESQEYSDDEEDILGFAREIVRCAQACGYEGDIIINLHDRSNTGAFCITYDSSTGEISYTESYEDDDNLEDDSEVEEEEF